VGRWENTLQGGLVITTDVRQKWLRVSREMPCPICGKRDWCLVAVDGVAVICARVQSVVRKGEAGWLHKLASAQLTMPYIPPAVKNAQQLPKASIKRRHAVYQSLLKALPLTPNHRKHLVDRGFTQKELNGLCYGSLPNYERRVIVHQLQQQGLKLAGIPGFWLKNGEVDLHGSPGILIPVRDAIGFIQGLQVRADNPGTGGKYRWISSADQYMGVSSGVPIHVARPASTTTSDIWITEGPLKADIAARRLGYMVLAVAGVGNWSGVIPVLQQLQPERVILAYDMDKNRNTTVRYHLDALITCLVGRGLRVFEADWDTRFKGLDDLITRG